MTATATRTKIRRLTSAELDQYFDISPYGALNAGPRYCGHCQATTAHVSITGYTTGTTYLMCHECGEQTED